MPAFKISNTSLVEEYLKSLDHFNHFEEIDVQQIANHLQIKINSKNKEVYYGLFEVSDRRTDQIFLGDEFYSKMNSLSAALEIQSRLAALKEFSISRIFFDPTWLTVQSENNLARYEVRVFDREDGFKIFIKVTFFERNEEIYSERMYCTDGKILDFSRLEEIVQKFDELDAVRTGK